MAKPEGVVIVRADGTELNCELVHEGVDEDGMDRWLVTGVKFNPRVDKIRIQHMPPRTGLGFDVAPGSEDAIARLLLAEEEGE